MKVEDPSQFTKQQLLIHQNYYCTTVSARGKPAPEEKTMSEGLSSGLERVIASVERMKGENNSLLVITPIFEDGEATGVLRVQDENKRVIREFEM